MGKTHLIMPMGGNGSRFKKNGIEVPKPLIEINGKPFFYWATMSIAKFMEVDITFVVLQEHVDNFSIDKKIKEYFTDANIVIIPHVLDGAVLTCLEGIKSINDNLPIIFNDCDHLFICKKFYDYCNTDNKSLDGLLLSFTSNEDKFSYLAVNEENYVKETVEKKVISNHAICGVYYIKNKKIFEETAKIYLDNCNYSEYYISGVYNVMAKNNLKIGYYDTDVHLSFGTPEEYEIAKTSNAFKELDI